MKKLLKGNEAFAEAAIRAGCRYYFGYPITPQNEITEYMSRELAKRNGDFIQAESELAAINMAYGASAAGGRVLISSSSPGVALMQESLSFICSCELPLVIINVSRGGPGVGSIQPGQADYLQATKGGGNGDYNIIVYAPASIQEAVDMIISAYEISEKYRNPVMILADGMLGQMMEPVVMPEFVVYNQDENIKNNKQWAITGHKEIRGRNAITSLNLVPERLEKHINKIWKKYEDAEKKLASFEILNAEEADIVFIAYGSTSRIVKEALPEIKKIGINAGLIRPCTLWPFPDEAFDLINSKAKTIISAELSKGQMIQDIKLAVNGRWPVRLLSRTGGMLISVDETIASAKAAMEE